jgi:hypothetical protein
MARQSERLALTRMAAAGHPGSHAAAALNTGGDYRIEWARLREQINLVYSPRPILQTCG